jgi:hypothetical protein
MLVLVVALVAVGFLVRLFAVKEKSLEGVITNPSMLTTVPDLITWLVRESTVKMGVWAADTRQLSIPMIMVKKYLFIDFIFFNC